MTGIYAHIDRQEMRPRGSFPRPQSLFHVCRICFAHEINPLFLPYYEIYDHQSTEQIHERMYAFELALDELYQNMNNDTCAKTVCNAACERGEHKHYAGADNFIKFAEVDVGKALEHQEANIYQRRTCGCIGYGNEKRRKKHRHEEHQSGNNGGKAGTSAGFNAGSRFNIGSDGRIAGERADACAYGIDQKWLFNAGEISVFIKHTGTAADSEYGAERGEEIAEEADEYQYKTAGREYAGEVKVEHDIAKIVEIRHGGDAGNRSNSAGYSDDCNCDYAYKYSAFDVERIQHDHKQQPGNGEQDRGVGNIPHCNAVDERTDAGVFKSEIGNEKTYRSGDGDFNVSGNDADYKIPQAENGQQDKHHAGNEDYCHRIAEADRLRLNKRAENEV